MSEFIAVTGGSDNEYTVCEHATTRVLTGEAEAVRARLVYALESLGYAVVSDSPLQARRARRRNVVAADFTDHTRRLAVGLRQRGAAATQVTFDFAVTHGGFMTKGDLLTLEREADAVAALASEPPETGLCRSCGTENGGEARFCRHCGAPNDSGAPAEVELLQLTAGARAGLQEIVCGLVLALLGAAALSPLMIFGKPKVAAIGLVLLVIVEAVAWWMTLYGILRQHRALKRRAEAKPLPAAAVPPPLAPRREAALPPAHFSVTEGTTELLGSAPREREEVPARREHGDTSPIG
jgi:ribosomal protein L40E